MPVPVNPRRWCDVAGGKEKTIGDLGDSAPSTWWNPGVRLTLAPDGKTFAYSVSKTRGDIWLLEGF